MTHAAFVSILSDCNQPLTSGFERVCYMCSIYGLVIVRLELPIMGGRHHQKYKVVK